MKTMENCVRVWVLVGVWCLVGAGGLRAGHDGVGAVVVDGVVDPVGETVQWVDRLAADVHCGIERDLQRAGAWPPRGVDRLVWSAVCDFKGRAREVRLAWRRGSLAPWQVSTLVRSAGEVDRRTERLELPCAIDQGLQDALDLVVVLQQMLGEAR